MFSPDFLLDLPVLPMLSAIMILMMIVIKSDLPDQQLVDDVLIVLPQISSLISYADYAFSIVILDLPCYPDVDSDFSIVLP